MTDKCSWFGSWLVPLFCFLVCKDGLPQRRVGVGYALRVSPAADGSAGPKCANRGFSEILMGHTWGVKIVQEAHDVPHARHRYLLQKRFCNITDVQVYGV